MTETSRAEVREDPGRPDAAVPAIELRGVGKTFQSSGESVAAVRELDLEIAQGSSSRCSGRPGAARPRRCA
ncbi:hypothetical protein ACFQHO_33715 [Actinomadura yumaensis]|uniref:hypothetical protein n=1 Tax=Actinomadura yumaensis TaxID=111807 RepID=UPI0036177C1E